MAADRARGLGLGAGLQWVWGCPGPAPTPTLPPQLLQQCRLVERILTSWEENDLVQ